MSSLLLPRKSCVEMGFCGFSIPAMLMLGCREGWNPVGWRAHWLGERWELLSLDSHLCITFTSSSVNSTCYCCISAAFVE